MEIKNHSFHLAFELMNFENNFFCKAFKVHFNDFLKYIDIVNNTFAFFNYAYNTRITHMPFGIHYFNSKTKRPHCTIHP